MLDEAAREGIDTDSVLASCNVTAEELDDPEARIPWQVGRDIAVEISRRAEGNFALSLGERIQTGQLGAYGYVLRNSTTLGEAYDRLCRYTRLVSDVTVGSLDVDGDRARLHFLTRVDLGPEGTRVCSQIWSAAVASLSKQLTHDRFKLESLQLPFARPDDLSEYRRIFGVEPRFDQSRTVLELDHSQLELPIVHADPKLGAVLVRAAERFLGTLPPIDGWANSVREALHRKLPGEAPTIAGVARSLGVSARTLQRRLHDQALSFRELLDRVRCELGLDYAADPTISTKEMAWLLGYASPGTFVRAFRRWTGMSPVEYRAQVRRPEAPEEARPAAPSAADQSIS